MKTFTKISSLLIVGCGIFVATLRKDPPPIDLKLFEQRGTKYFKVSTGNRERIVEYAISGSNKDDATPMIFFHSFTFTAKEALIWDSEFNKHNLRVYSMSMPGFGLSTAYSIKDSHRTLQNTIGDAKRLIEVEGIVGDLLVSGYSYGSVEAANACRYLDNVKGCMLLQPMTPSSMDQEVGLELDWILHTLKSLTNKPYIGELLAWLMSSVHPATMLSNACPDGPAMIGKLRNDYPKIYEKVIDDMRSSSMHTFRGIIDGSRLMEIPLDFRYEDIDIPNVFVVSTRDDETNPFEYAKYIASKIPGARLRTLPDGHYHFAIMVTMDQVLEEFLKGQ